MQASVSPKKYIETRVRNLPVYKCLVNNDWETSSMANVIVMRQHVNGNVSGGIYLVDLLCLGVKETIWFFNETEAEIMERFNTDDTLQLETIDYDLAHNIVYAGRDFAMTYDIHPHPEFKTSRFVLEEDDDSVPLMDIPTGYGEDGIPHLMANQPGQYADALAKLKKNAGEGNYLYTIGMDDDLEDDYENNNGDEFLAENENLSNELLDLDEAIKPLSDFPDGELTLQNVQEVLLADLVNEGKVAERNTMDKMICLTEMMLRILPDNFYQAQQDWANAEWDELEAMVDLPNGITDADFEEWKTVIEKSNADDTEERDEAAAMEQLSENMETQFGHNPFVATSLIADAIFTDDKDKIEDLFAKWQSQHGHLPLFQLLKAFYGVLKNNSIEKPSEILAHDNLADAFPLLESFNELEFALFHALQCIRHCKLNQLPEAVQHYYLAAGTDIVHILFMPTMEELLPLLQIRAMEKLESEE